MWTLAALCEIIDERQRNAHRKEIPVVRPYPYFIALRLRLAAATLAGRHERLDALNAAFVGAMSSSALAFKDTAHDRPLGA